MVAPQLQPEEREGEKVEWKRMRETKNLRKKELRENPKEPKKFRPEETIRNKMRQWGNSDRKDIKSASLELVNMTSFGEKVFADGFNFMTLS